MNSASTGIDQALGWVVEQVTARLEAGEALDAEAVAREYPDHADELRELLPTLAALAGLVTRLPDGTPRVMGDFHIDGVLGRGGMGIVYRARQVSLGRDVALKVLPVEATLDLRRMVRFQNEARAAGSLSHPNIVPVYAVGREGDFHFYAMRLIDGCNLAEVVRALRQRGRPADLPDPDRRTKPYAGPVDEIPPGESALAGSVAADLALRGGEFFRTAAGWAATAAEALHHAHQVGIIHRDVKPGNLLLDRSGQVWVTDFGLAQLPSGGEMTRTGAMPGTPRYMSPEQAAGLRAVLDERTDVYSLGVTLYELLTLEPAFSGGDSAELQRLIATEDPRPLRSINPAIPTELETVVLKAIAKDPADRYTTAKELAEDLDRFVRDDPIRARRPTLVQRARRWVRRYRSLVAVAAAGLLVCLAVAGAAVGWIAHDWQTRRETGNHLVAQAVDEASAHREQRRYADAVAAARKAEALAASYPVDPVWRQRAADLRLQVDGEQEAAERDRRLLAALLDAGIPAERDLVPSFRRDAAGRMAVFAGPTLDQLYAEAFRAWGLDVDVVPTAEAAARLGARPAAVVEEVVAALDAWAAAIRQANGDWRRYAALAGALDAGRTSWQRELRAILERGQLEQERAVGALAGFLVPLGPLAGLVPGEDRNRLRQLAEQIDVRTAPATGVTTLARSLEQVGDRDRAVRILRAAATTRLDQPLLAQTLGLLLARMPREHFNESVEWLRAARMLRPSLSLHLAVAVTAIGRADEGVQLLEALVREEPDNPTAHLHLGRAYFEQGNYRKAEAAQREAIRLKPDFPLAHTCLGMALAPDPRRPDFGDMDAAIASYREAIRLAPLARFAHQCLARLLKRKGDMAGAVAAYRTAIRIHFPHEPELLDELRQAERNALFWPGLAAVLAGTQSPAGAEEAAGYARCCLDTQRNLDAVRLYSQALATDPVRARLGDTATQYNAACVAALAAAGKGVDAGQISDAERTDLRRQALDWLRRELAWQKDRIDSNEPGASTQVAKMMRHWQYDPDLVSVREQDTLAALPKDERDAWRRLWAEVAYLARLAELIG